ncbi:MAG: HAMP domain-containing histidine kinase [Pontiellaceae bacterium]|jgi:signal transduction histidine kinase|nr:HAMP domain-containing histidine kinase [Pontiellaceae bacterium]
MNSKLTAASLDFCTASLLLLLIGMMDWLTGFQVSFSLFYLIPLAWFALSDKKKTRSKTTLLSVEAALIWLIVDFFTNPIYTHFIFSFWNALVRLILFLLISQLLLSVKEKTLSLEKSNRRLTELNNEKNRFIGIAAHDLRTPIGAILSLSELLLESSCTDPDAAEKNSEQIELLHLIHQSSEDALNLMKNMLDVSKIESGTLTLNRSPVNYPGLIKKCIQLQTRSADNKRISIVYEGPETLSATLDPQYIEEAVNNLLTNAIKFSKPESTIRVNVSAGNRCIRTEVADQGAGIPADEIPRLFQFFSKTSTRPTAGESSTGLGLAIIKKVIALHGGTVGVTSQVNQGSTFFFELPSA